MNIRRILIANRGEIAVRIIRSCRRLGIETVLAASDADLGSLGARMADQVVRIGPPRPAESYLSIDAIIEAALAGKVDAIHPGYGFLSENAQLAIRCREAGLIFIGPTEAQLDGIGDKLKARGHAVEAGLPVVPGGSMELGADPAMLAQTIGWPILVKAVGGGGGRGMKQVHDPAKLHETVELAIAEAQASFGDPRVYLERYVASGRHVEVQILGDGETIIHLGTRDCSVQRRYQKLVEEAPAPDLSDGLRAAMHKAAVDFGRHMRYRGLGTIEFLLDCKTDEFFFLEMNARIQVEHPVTEAITGLDLVAEQIAVAEGRPLGIRQDDIAFDGHSIECRINAEDWDHDFRPSPGTATRVLFPAGDGIRVDSHMEAGSTVSPYYDSMVAKLIVHAPDRARAVARMAQALEVCRIDGLTINTAMHKALMASDAFKAGGVDTGFFPRFMQSR
jgi:acetyl-CoA carboxylase biotin carboxylase subunit